MATTVLRVENMTCGGCEKGVRATLAEAAPGARVAVDLARREVTVEGAAEGDAVLAALKADGWEASRRA